MNADPATKLTRNSTSPRGAANACVALGLGSLNAVTHSATINAATEDCDEGASGQESQRIQHAAQRPQPRPFANRRKGRLHQRDGHRDAPHDVDADDENGPGQGGAEQWQEAEIQQPQV